MDTVFFHRLEVRFRDCDPMGHANNAVYLTYLEQARFAHWRVVVGVRTLAGSSRKRPRASSWPAWRCDYRRPAKYGDMLEIRLGVVGIGARAFTYEYEDCGRGSSRTGGVGRKDGAGDVRLSRRRSRSRYPDDIRALLWSVSALTVVIRAIRAGNLRPSLRGALDASGPAEADRHLSASTMTGTSAAALRVIEHRFEVRRTLSSRSGTRRGMPGRRSGRARPACTGRCPCRRSAPPSRHASTILDCKRNSSGLTPCERFHIIETLIKPRAPVDRRGPADRRTSEPRQGS